MSLKTRSNWMRIAVIAGIWLLFFSWNQACAWQGNPALTTYTAATTPGSTVVSIELDFKYDFDSAIYVVGPSSNRVKYTIEDPQQGTYTMQTDVVDSGATTTQFASIMFFQYKGGHSEHYGELFFMVDGSGTAFQSAAPVIGAVKEQEGKSMSIPLYQSVDTQFNFADRVTCESGSQCSTCQISAGTSIPGTGGGICVSPDPANGNLLTVSSLLRLESSGGDCTSCGGGSPGSASGGLDFSASTQTQAIAQTTDLGPMHATNWCTKLEFYESNLYYFGHTIYLYRNIFWYGWSVA